MTVMGRRETTTYLLASVAAVVVTAAGMLSPQLLLVIPGAAVAYGLTKPWFRLLFFAVGAFWVFQSGDALSIPKLGYLAAVIYSVACAVHGLGKHAAEDDLTRVRPALIGAGLLAFWVICPMLVQGVILNNVPAAMWARDALTYLLISAGVVIGIDAAREVSLKWARLVTLGVGLLAAYGFAAEWIGRRGLLGDATANYTSENPLLGSFVAMTLPLAMCLVLGLAQRGVRWKWLILAPVFVLTVLITGTRTGFVLAVALIGILGLQRKKRVTFARATLGGVTGVAALSIALPAASAMFSSEDFVQQRIDSTVRTLQDGFGSDASGVIRQRATEFSLDIFSQHPLMGQGFGTYFPNPNPGGRAMNFSLDSWAVLPAKFGVIGTLVVALAIILIFHGLTRRGNGEWLYENTAVRAVGITIIALMPFGLQTEDKGFAVIVALAATLVCAAAKESRAIPDRTSGVARSPAPIRRT